MLGIDLGTTGIKALVIESDSGAILARAYRSYPSQTGADGRHEQDPEDWWTVCAEVTHEVLAAHPPTSIAAVGVSGHMHGVVLIDGEDRYVRPAMTWADRRDVRQVARLRTAAGHLFVARGSNPVVEALTAPKVAWLAEHEPTSLDRAVQLVLAKDVLRHRLTGTWGTDLTDARGTLLYDVHRDAWDPELWATCGVDPALAPTVTPSTTVVGAVTAEAAMTTGLAPGTPVVAGAGDVACSALGAGVVGEGVVHVNVGTAAQVTTVLPSPVPGEHFVFGRADSRGFLAMASVYAAGLSVDWAARTLLGLDGPAPLGPAVDELAQQATTAAREVAFLPHLLGTSVPTHEPAARGALLGLDANATTATVARAVLEGVAFACTQAVGAVAGLTGGLRRVHVGGGLSRSSVWRDTVAAVLEVPLFRVGEDASARGAAMLAGLGIGLWSNAQDAAATCVRAEKLPAPAPGATSESRQALSTYEMASEALLGLTRLVRERSSAEMEGSE